MVCVCKLIAVLGYRGMELAAIISSFSYFIVGNLLKHIMLKHIRFLGILSIGGDSPYSLILP